MRGFHTDVLKCSYSWQLGTSLRQERTSWRWPPSVGRVCIRLPASEHRRSSWARCWSGAGRWAGRFRDPSTTGECDASPSGRATTWRSTRPTTSRRSLRRCRRRPGRRRRRRRTPRCWSSSVGSCSSAASSSGSCCLRWRGATVLDCRQHRRWSC